MVISNNMSVQAKVQAVPSVEHALPPSPMNESADKTLGGRAADDLTLGGQPVPPSGRSNGVDNEAKLDRVVAALNDYVQALQRDLEFSVDRESGRTVIKVLDRHTQDVVRQIPSEEVLALARQLESMKEESNDGLLLRLRV